MKEIYKAFHRMVEIISLIICIIIIFLIIIYPVNDDLIYETEQKCGNTPIYIYFFEYIDIILYTILRSVLSISFLLTGECSLKFLYVLVPLYIGYIILLATSCLYRKLIIRIIFIIVDSFFNVISLILCCVVKEKCREVYSISFKCNSDCLDIYFENRNKKKLEEIPKIIINLENENALLKQRNQEIYDESIKLKNTNYDIHYSNVESKKIEAIIWYVKKKYNKSFDSDILYQNLLNEIKDNCGIKINKEKLKEIFLLYVKEKFAEYLKCPLKADFFENPLITPEGQTFDKEYLLKEIQKTGKNPITLTKLNENQLLENKLLRDLCEIFKSNYDNFNMNTFLKMRRLLINKNTDTFYSYPIVLRNGYTEEGIGINNNEEYSNRVILNLIEQNKELLSEEFINSL